MRNIGIGARAQPSAASAELTRPCLSSNLLLGAVFSAADEPEQFHGPDAQQVFLYEGLASGLRRNRSTDRDTLM
jgi:hypothetical protein